MKTKVTVLILFLLAAGVMIISGCKLKPAAHNDGAAAAANTPVIPATPVSVMTLTPTDMSEEIEVTGTLQPADEVTVGTRAEGRVAWLIGKEGTPVHRGDVVARLEDQDTRTLLRSAHAAFNAAVAHVEQAKAAAAQQITATDSGIENAQAAVAAAEARLQQSISHSRGHGCHHPGPDQFGAGHAGCRQSETR